MSRSCCRPIMCTHKKASDLISEAFLFTFLILSKINFSSNNSACLIFHKLFKSDINIRTIYCTVFLLRFA